MENGKIVLNKNSLRVDYGGGSLTFDEYDVSSQWKSLQFHFHAPSEHTIDGKVFDSELHIVFKGITHPGEIAVVGILFEEDSQAEDNKFLESLFIQDLQKPFSEKEIAKSSFGPLLAALETSDNFHYQGSLTTPGYDESVQWFVYTLPVKISKKQNEILTEFWKGGKYDQCSKGNARDCQEQGSRIVHKIKHGSTQ